MTSASIAGLKQGMKLGYFDDDHIVVGVGSLHVHEPSSDIHHFARLTDVLPITLTDRPADKWMYVYVTAPEDGELLSASNFSIVEDEPSFSEACLGYYFGDSRCIGAFRTDEDGNVRRFDDRSDRFLLTDSYIPVTAQAQSLDGNAVVTHDTPFSSPAVDLIVFQATDMSLTLSAREYDSNSAGCPVCSINEDGQIANVVSELPQRCRLSQADAAGEPPSTLPASVTISMIGYIKPDFVGDVSAVGIRSVFEAEDFTGSGVLSLRDEEGTSVTGDVTVLGASGITVDVHDDKMTIAAPFIPSGHCQFRAGTGTNIALLPAPLNYDTTDVSSNVASINASNDIDIHEDGLYEITVHTAVDVSSGGTRANVRHMIYVGVSEHTMGRAWSYNRNASNGEMSVETTILYQASAGDTISARVQEEGSSGNTMATVDDQCWIILRKVGP